MLISCDISKSNLQKKENSEEKSSFIGKDSPFKKGDERNKGLFHILRKIFGS